MSLELTQEAADRALGSLLEWGVGGAILAVFVAPTFLLMVRGAQKREDARAQRDAEDARRHMEREDKLVAMLTTALELQKSTHDHLAKTADSRAMVDARLVAAFDASAKAMAEIQQSIHEGRELTRQAAAALGVIAESLRKAN